MDGIKIMNHYITTGNKTWGFDAFQKSLIPSDAVLRPKSYTFDQFPYLTLVNGTIQYNQSQHDADIENKKQQQDATAKAQQDIISKIIALGITADEVKALIG